MRFEKFLLDNYMATDEGQRVFQLFENMHTLIDAGDKDKTVINFINSLLYAPIAKDFFYFEPLKEPIEIGELEHPPFSEFEDWIRAEIEDIKTDWDCSYRDLLSEIPALSLSVFFRFAPEYAFPYLYPTHFNVLHNIFEEFSIIIPPLPGPRQYEMRCHYYISLCKSLYEFRLLHNMTPVELCVFLYGFAPKFVAHNAKQNTPLPNVVWVAGATQDDSEYYLKNIKKNSVQWWAGNSRMQHGDIVLLYEQAPYSAIKSIWRAVSDGFDEPFQYFPGKVWLGEPISIPPVSFTEMKNDHVLSQCCLIIAKMYGLGGGRALKAEEYQAFLNILKEKGIDTKILPELLSYSLNIDVDINTEQDVEMHILEPFLKKLGVQPKHITRQMPLRMGRGIRYYPDYVINAKTTRGEERGAFVWEAKYRITNKKQMINDYYQAKSYARRLDTNGLGLVSCEGIWLSFAADDYSVDKVEHFTWADLQNADIFSRVAAMLKKAFGKL